MCPTQCIEYMVVVADVIETPDNMNQHGYDTSSLLPDLPIVCDCGDNGHKGICIGPELTSMCLTQSLFVTRGCRLALVKDFLNPFLTL